MPDTSKDTGGLGALDGLLQPIIRLAAVCYAAGLIIESAFLSAHGVSGFDLVKSQYILVGVSWAAQTAVVYCLIKLCRYGSRNMTILKRGVICVGVLTLLSMFLDPLLTGVVYLPNKTKYEELILWLMVFEGMITLAGTGYFIEKLVKLRRLVIRKQATSIIYNTQPKSFFLAGIEPDSQEMVKVAIAFGFAVFAIPMYANSIFPLIPQIAGGGKLQMVSIILKPGKADIFRNFEGLQSNLAISSKSMVTRVFLLADQSDGYVVTSSERGAQINVLKTSFKIPKEDVELIVQHPMTF